MLAREGRYLRVRAQEFDQLGFKFQGQYYFDKVLPFGLFVSPAMFELFATFLEWLVVTKVKIRQFEALLR